jgi:hypothetical protein
MPGFLLRYSPLLLVILIAVVSCARPKPAPLPIPPVTSEEPDLIGELLESAAPLARMGFSVQVGAFTDLDNAVRLEQQLEAKGIDAYYFRHESGLYKVRFGNHTDYAAARSEAEALQSQGLIDSFFIVIPQDYAAARIAKSGHGDLGQELVATAKRFIGIPYRWGGEDRKNGFDCSGLTMVCYRLNGLNLPRNSRAQHAAGKKIAKKDLRPGDLVFFATKGGSRVTHVGLYIGRSQFIHAPRTGKDVCIERLDKAFFSKTYVGGRRYF